MNSTNFSTSYLSWKPKPRQFDYKDERILFCILVVFLVKTILMIIYKDDINKFYKKHSIKKYNLAKRQGETSKMNNSNIIV